MIQLEAGLRRHRLPGRIVHVVELLEEAYGESGQSSFDKAPPPGSRSV
jgi:hypothetical protein